MEGNEVAARLSVAPAARVGIVGAGTMGLGIALVAARAGHMVCLHDESSAALSAAQDRLAAEVVRLGSSRPGTRDDWERAAGRVQVVTDAALLSNTAIVIEAIVEDLSAKRQLLCRLEDVVAPECILASNTSTLSVTALAAKCRAPGRVVGLHFFNPAPQMELVEVVHGLATDPAVTAAAADLATRWGKRAVMVRSSPGFIVNRIARHFYGEGIRAIEQGLTTPETWDAALTGSCGFRMGPFMLMDLIGIDVNYTTTRQLHEAFFAEPRFRPSHYQRELVEAGRLGRKSGLGVYAYRDGRAMRSPAAAAPRQPPPRAVRVGRDAAALSGLLQRVRNAGIPVDVEPTLPSDMIDTGGCLVTPTDGRTAAERSASLGRPVAVVDIVMDWASARGVAVGCAKPTASAEVCGLLQAAGLEVFALGDYPGLAAARTLALLINESVEVSLYEVATRDDVDLAMRLGAGWPAGPFEWLEQVSPAVWLAILSNLQAEYGDSRYRPSQRLRAMSREGGRWEANEAGTLRPVGGLQ